MTRSNLQADQTRRTGVLFRVFGRSLFVIVLLASFLKVLPGLQFIAESVIAGQSLNEPDGLSNQFDLGVPAGPLDALGCFFRPGFVVIDDAGFDCQHWSILPDQTERFSSFKSPFELMAQDGKAQHRDGRRFDLSQFRFFATNVETTSTHSIAMGSISESLTWSMFLTPADNDEFMQQVRLVFPKTGECVSLTPNSFVLSMPDFVASLDLTAAVFLAHGNADAKTADEVALLLSEKEIQAVEYLLSISSTTDPKSCQPVKLGDENWQAWCLPRDHRTFLILHRNTVDE